MAVKPVSFLLAYLLTLLRRFERWLAQFVAPNPRQRGAAPAAMPEEWPKPPEHWLAHVRPHPPAYWIEHIRSRAPHLLDSGFHHYVSPALDDDRYHHGAPPVQTRTPDNARHPNLHPQHPGRGSVPHPRPTPVHFCPTGCNLPNPPSSPINLSPVNAPNRSEHSRAHTSVEHASQRTSGPTVLFQPSTRVRQSAHHDLRFVNGARTTHKEPERQLRFSSQEQGVDVTEASPVALAYGGIRPRPAASPGLDVVSTPHSPTAPAPTRMIATQQVSTSPGSPNPPLRPRLPTFPAIDRNRVAPVAPSPALPQRETGKWAPLIEEDDTSVVYRLAHTNAQTGDARHEQRLDDEQRGQTWNEWPS